MEANFWHQRWATNDIGWHEQNGSALLATNFKVLSLPPLSRVFVPLCGKTLDIGWLLSQDCQVVAIELNETAIEELFIQLGVEPVVSQSGSLKKYSALNLDVFAGDFFALSAGQLGSVDAVFDRASMVALPNELRAQYTKHLVQVTNNAQLLLIVFEYDQNEIEGPPFSISVKDINRHYESIYSILTLDSHDMTGQLRGDFAATENAYLLQPLD